MAFKGMGSGHGFSHRTGRMNNWHLLTMGTGRLIVLFRSLVDDMESNPDAVGYN